MNRYEIEDTEEFDGLDPQYDFASQEFSEQPTNEDEEDSDALNEEEYDCFDAAVDDLDFSYFSTSVGFKKSFEQVNNKVKAKENVKLQKVTAPPNRPVIIEGVRPRTLNRPTINAFTKKPVPFEKPKSGSIPLKSTQIKTVPLQSMPLQKSANLFKKGQGKISKIIVPTDKKVIVEGVSKFILSQKQADDACRNTGYYKGEKLKELVLTYNNDSAIDFNLEVFNPSMPLDYLYSTSLTLNDKIQVGGGNVSYTDVLYNILANPTLIVNAKFVFAGPLVQQQFAIPLIVKNKRIDAIEKIDPYNLSLQIDNMQVQSDQVCFNIEGVFNRPYIPDGMDVMQYKILAGMTVTMCFYYKQVSLKRVLLEEARNSKKLL